MLGLLADALTERGYDLILSRVIPANEDWLDRFTDSGRVDGFNVIGQSDQAETLDRVAGRYRPLVVWGGHEKGQVNCSVGSDNVAGGDLAAIHLIERGCRKIAFFGDPTAREIKQRLAGCRAAMARAGLGDDPRVFPAHLAAGIDDASISQFLADKRQRPDGIVAASDVIAMSTLRALSELGISVPADIKVIGYGNLTIGEHTVPCLSTIKQLKALRFKTPYEAIEELWNSKPDIFIVKPNHHMVGPNT
ncbi:MAG: substrate-binding domain-containing protein [Sphingomonadaceae bacterium]|nr:substrate-binding domain-containing protein [Sphingomonadaceae bacterium]